MTHVDPASDNDTPEDVNGAPSGEGAGQQDKNAFVPVSELDNGKYLCLLRPNTP